MKITAFEVRQDEVEYFHQYAETYQVEVELHSEILTPEMISTLTYGTALSILGQAHYGHEELEQLAKQGVRAISLRTIGYNQIDLDAAKKLGISVCNAAYAPNGVADYTVMMILLCLRKYKQALWRMQVNDYSLEGLLGREIKDLTIGVMGTGRIGANVIQDLSGFGCKILVYDQHPNEKVEDLVEYVPLDTLYAQSDVITLHMPLFPSTKHIINADSIAKMKDGVVIINCARGALADVQALIEGIESEKIGALGIDCIEQEENIVHRDRRTDIFSNKDMAYLRQFKNVVYTQHMAFYTDAAVQSMVECGVRSICQMLNGEPCATRLV